MSIVRTIANAVLDPAWAFLLAGLGILGAAALIPAEAQLAEARHRRDRAIAYEQLHVERLDRHRAYLQALDRADPVVLRSLAASQLNLVPAGLSALHGVPVDDSANVFVQLEPEAVASPELRQNDSRLAQLAMNSRTRAVLLIIGAVAVFAALLPAANRRG